MVGAADYYFNDSGWYPRTREIPVYAKASDWVMGELKMCFSSESAGNSELTALVCDAGSMENHTLNVTFWGPLTTERPKLWECERGREVGREREWSITCRL